MKKIKVGIVGHGTIGKRVAKAVFLQDDMELVGIVARSFNWRIETAQQKGYPIYSLDDGKDLKDNGIKVQGTVHELLQKIDIMIDTSPKKIGAENKEKFYVPNKIKAIFQGGEKNKIAEASFCAQCNYDEAWGKDFIRVVSCNTTGLSRTLNEINKRYGIKEVYATMIRRAADPWDIHHGPINSVVPVLELPSHHGPDVRTILHDVEIFTTAMSTSTTLMHTHSIICECKEIPNIEEVINIFKKTPRVRVVENSSKVRSTAEIMELARDLERNVRGDMPEICVWKEAIGVHSNKLLFIQAIHQESNVVCENIDAIRSMFKLMPAEESIKKTNDTMSIKT